MLKSKLIWGRRVPRFLLLSLVAASPVCVRCALAQEVGTLRVVVIDASTQRPLSSATVIVQARSRTTASDSLGVARIGELPEGLYVVVVRHIGYVPAREVNVRVTRGKVTILSAQLGRAAQQLDVIGVTAEAFPKEADQDVSHFTYTADEIRRTPGAAGDLFRAIETLPGVSSSGGEFSAFSVRGGGPRDNLILIDDIPFDKVTHLEGGIESDEAQGGRFSIFAPDLVQSADFRAGGFSAQYGGKDASVLSLRLRDGNIETPTFGGRYDLLGWEADYDGPSGLLANTSILASARHENLERALKLIGRADAGKPSFTDAIVKTTTTAGRRNRLTVLAIFAPEQVLRTVDNILTESDTNDAALYYWKETKAVVGASLRTLVGGVSIIQTTAYARRYTRTSQNGAAYPDVPIDGGRSIAARPDVLSADESETQVGLRSVAHLVHGAHSLISSVELAGRSIGGGRSVSGFDTLYSFGKNDPRPSPSTYYVVITPQTYDARIERRVTDAAFSSSYRRVVGADGDVTVGARLERDGVSGRTNVSPRLSGSSPAWNGITFTAAGGLYLEPLLVRDLIGSESNASLPPQRATHAIVGLSRLLRPDVKLTVEGYYRGLRDLAVRRDETSGVEGAIGTGYASGLDVTVIKRLVEKFFGQVGYSFSQSRRNDHRGDGWYDADGNQPHAFNVLGGYTLDSRWSFSGKFKFAEGKPTDVYVVHDTIFGASGPMRFSQEIVGHNAARFPDLHTLNVRADYQRQAGAVDVDAFLDVLNAYDRLNVNNARFVERTGRLVYDGVRIVPTFGLKILY
jgi:carboxypeptidase family protein/TonB-dependent receptor-like protein